MAKKTKESEQTEIKTAKKSATSSKKSTTTKTVAKKTSAKKSSTTKKSATTKKSPTAKKASTTKKVATTAKKTSAAAKKTTTTKKASTAKNGTTRKKAVSSKAKKSDLKQEIQFKSEYYDLPYMYNKTVVKVLAQTPKMLFIYWEISEDDRANLIKTFGENFFETTRPVLIVYNDTMHYSFEVDINDFANSWYLHINDADCNYHVELGRRPYPESYQKEPVYIPYYIYLTSSNEMTAPNNRILFNPEIKTVRFRNVKTGQVVDKDIKQFTFITNFGIFTIQDLYRYLYPNENFEYENIVLGNTSSGALSSSGMFSSQFK